MNWNTITSLFFGFIYLAVLYFATPKKPSPFWVYLISAFALQIITYFLADATSSFDERLFLPSAICLTIIFLTSLESKKALFIVGIFCAFRLLPVIKDIDRNISLFAKSQLEKTATVQFLKLQEKNGKLCLLYANKNHTALFENAEYIRLLKIKITAKPQIEENIKLAKEQGHTHCFFTERPNCSSDLYLCLKDINLNKEKVFEDPLLKSNGGNIYRIHL